MAYSRWSHSVWYTYWDSSLSCTCPTLATRLNQKFTIAGIASFSYRELKESLDECIDMCEPKSEHERGELEKYIKEFFKDVESEYKR